MSKIALLYNSPLSEYISQLNSSRKIDFTKEALKMAPEYFWHVPASSTGKHHPSFAQGEGGLVRHTLAALEVVNQLLMAYPQIEEDQDNIIIAIILHDTIKRGYPDTGKTVEEHPSLPRKYYQKLSGIIGEEDYTRIMDLIETHMGIWYVPPKAEYGRISPAEIVHLADFIASKTFLNNWISGREKNIIVSKRS
jgi:hypothetical protein